MESQEIAASFNQERLNMHLERAREGGIADLTRHSDFEKIIQPGDTWISYWLGIYLYHYAEILRTKYPASTVEEIMFLETLES